MGGFGCMEINKIKKGNEQKSFPSFYINISFID